MQSTEMVYHPTTCKFLLAGCVSCNKCVFYVLNFAYIPRFIHSIHKMHCHAEIMFTVTLTERGMLLWD